MRVDVVRLRRHGQKIERPEVLAAEPIRAVLTITTFNGLDQYSHAVRSISAQMLDAAGDVVSTMTQAEVTSMVGDSFVVSGIENYVPAIGASERWPQSWWCRVVRV